VDAVVLPLFRCGHDLQPHIVVDGGGRDEPLLAAHRCRDKAQILLQQHDDLIHVQAEIRDGIPVRQMIIRDKLVPPLQLVGDKLSVVFHNDAPHIRFAIQYITNQHIMQQTVRGNILTRVY